MTVIKTCKRCGKSFRCGPRHQFCDPCKIAQARDYSLRYVRHLRHVVTSSACKTCGATITREVDKESRYTVGPLPERCKPCRVQRKKHQAREGHYYRYHMRNMRKQGGAP